MKTAITRSLWWKELHESRWAWYAGATILLVFPLLQVTINCWTYAEHVQLDTWRYSYRQNLAHIAYGGGAFFALMIAIMIVSRDVSDTHVEPWRTLPIRTISFILVKFTVGLSILLSVLTTLLILQGVFDWILPNSYQIGSRHPLSFYLLRTFLFVGVTQISIHTAIYAATFGLACWTRRAIPAMFLGCIVGLLIYFAPILAPSLNFMNPFDFQRHAMRINPLWTIGGELVIFAIGLGLALVVTIKQWQLRLGVTQLAWLFAIAGLGLFSIAAVQVGNNL